MALNSIGIFDIFVPALEGCGGECGAHQKPTAWRARLGKQTFISPYALALPRYNQHLMYWAIAVCLIVCLIVTIYWSGGPFRTTSPGPYRFRNLLIPLRRYTDYTYITLSTFLSSYYALNSTHGPDPAVATLVLLLRPLPWQLSLPPPLPRPLLTSETITVRQQHLPYLRINALFRLRDTPLRSLYRMWELTGDVCCAANERALKEETTYFIYQYSWRLDTIPDPHDMDPVRYAFLASLVERLVEVANNRARQGLRRDRMHPGPEERRKTRENPGPFLEKAPEWVGTVPGVKEPLWLFPEGVTNVDERFCEPGLLRRNIRRDRFTMHFI